MVKKYKCEIKPYRLNFLAAVKTSRNTIEYRDIWTIRIFDNFGRDGFGEIAPLEGLSRELTMNFEEKLTEVAENIEYFIQNKIELLDFPSIIFGLESAWLSYKHRDFVFFKTPFTLEQKPIPMNALVWMGDFEYMKSQVDKILNFDVKCIKLKVGGIDFTKELELIQYIRKLRPIETLDLRLDANGAFKAEDALSKLKLLAEYQIHSIEQPIKAGQIEKMAQLIIDSPIPIALDEELIGINSYKAKSNLLEVLKPDYIVLKPSLHGGLIGCDEWIFIAGLHKTKWWATSALESNIGLNTIAQWCSRYEESYSFPQGLGTGNLFENNFPTHLTVSNYHISIDQKN